MLVLLFNAARSENNTRLYIAAAPPANEVKLANANPSVRQSWLASYSCMTTFRLSSPVVHRKSSSTLNYLSLFLKQASEFNPVLLAEGVHVEKPLSESSCCQANSFKQTRDISLSASQ